MQSLIMSKLKTAPKGIIETMERNFIEYCSQYLAKVFMLNLLSVITVFEVTWQNALVCTHTC